MNKTEYKKEIIDLDVNIPAMCESNEGKLRGGFASIGILPTMEGAAREGSACVNTKSCGTNNGCTINNQCSTSPTGTSTSDKKSLNLLDLGSSVLF